MNWSEKDQGTGMRRVGVRGSAKPRRLLCTVNHRIVNFAVSSDNPQSLLASDSDEMKELVVISPKVSMPNLLSMMKSSGLTTPRWFSIGFTYFNNFSRKYKHTANSTGPRTVKEKSTML